MIKLDDAAVVIRKQGGKPKVKQAQNLVGADTLGGAIWGMLIGLLYFMPWFGLAVGATASALSNLDRVDFLAPVGKMFLHG